MVSKKTKLNLLLLFIFAGVFLFVKNASPEISESAPTKTNPESPIRIGYFHGGRTALLMRAYSNKEFDAAGLPVEFYATKLRSDKYELIPKSITRFNQESGGEFYAGKARGTELTDAIMAGKMDLAMVGESSFLESMYAGKPIVAIAELGHDVKGHSGHVMLMRDNIEIKSPGDFLGKILVSRRAGPGDGAFMRAFLDKCGVDIKKDILQLSNTSLPKNLMEKRKLPKNKIIVIDDMYEDVMRKGLENGIIDGGYFHLMFLEGPRFVGLHLLQPLHAWANPELSHALLVCHKDFLRKNQNRLIKLIEVYIKRIKYEHSLSYEERTNPPDKTKGFKMACNISGLNYPQYDLIPTTSVELLYDVQKLLIRYSTFRKKKLKIENFVDNSLVLKAAENLGITEKDDYWQSEY